MKALRSLLVGVTISAFSICNAFADQNCWMYVNWPSYEAYAAETVPLNGKYGYNIIFGCIYYTNACPASLDVVFYGTKNGVPDIGPEGESFPGSFAPNTGGAQMRVYENVGGFTGAYQRYAVLKYSGTNTIYCTTNTVSLSLQ